MLPDAQSARDDSTPTETGSEMARESCWIEPKEGFFGSSSSSFLRLARQKSTAAISQRSPQSIFREEASFPSTDYGKIDRLSITRLHSVTKFCVQPQLPLILK